MIAALVVVLLACQVTPELKQHVDAGLKAKNAGDLDAAIREFQRVVELAPGLAAAHVNLGAVYYDKKDYAHAIPPLHKALEINPDLPGAQAMLGAALLAQGYASQSIPYLEKVQADDLLGVALFESGRLREAIDKLEAAILKRPGDPDLLYYLSQAHGQLSKVVYDQLAQQSPPSARSHELFGDAQAALGNRDAAEKEYRAALAARPDMRGMHYSLGELYLGSADYENAEREFRDEARVAPGSANTAYKLGVVLLDRGEVQAALAELRRADTLMPDKPETLLELGKATATVGDYTAAERLFRRVLDQEPASNLAEPAHFQLAQLYRKLGRSTDADRELKLFQDLRKARK